MVHQASALRIRKKPQQTELATGLTVLAEAEDLKALGVDQSPAEIYKAPAISTPWEDTKEENTEANKEVIL